MLNFALNRGVQFPGNGMLCGGAAAGGGHLDMLKYLATIAFRPSQTFITVVAEAAKHGHTDVVRYGIDQGYHMSYVCTMEAASGRHLDILKLLVERGCEVSSETFNCAASSGSLEILQYLFEKSSKACRWEAWTFAARSGNVALMELLWEKKVSNNPHTIEFAAKENHLGPIKFALDHGFSYDRERVLFIAEKYDRQYLLKWFKGRLKY